LVSILDDLIPTLLDKTFPMGPACGVRQSVGNGFGGNPSARVDPGGGGGGVGAGPRQWACSGSRRGCGGPPPPPPRGPQPSGSWRAVARPRNRGGGRHRASSPTVEWARLAAPQAGHPGFGEGARPLVGVRGQESLPRDPPAGSVSGPRGLGQAARTPTTSRGASRVPPPSALPSFDLVSGMTDPTKRLHCIANALCMCVKYETEWPAAGNGITGAGAGGELGLKLKFTDRKDLMNAPYYRPAGAPAAASSERGRHSTGLRGPQGLSPGGEID